MTTTEDERLEIHHRYWRDWAVNPGWGNWYPCRPNIKYPSEDENRLHVLKAMRDRIAKIKAKKSIFSPVEYKIVKVREIKIVEDV
jgi:hypothetical protein